MNLQNLRADLLGSAQGEVIDRFRSGNDKVDEIVQFLYNIDLVRQNRIPIVAFEVEHAYSRLPIELWGVCLLIERASSDDSVGRWNVEVCALNERMATQSETSRTVVFNLLIQQVRYEVRRTSASSLGAEVTISSPDMLLGPVLAQNGFVRGEDDRDRWKWIASEDPDLVAS